MALSPSVISGVVHGPRGEAVANARVYFTDGPVPLPDIAALTDRDGAFSLTAPAPGKYVIECATDEFAVRSQAVSVSGGQPARLEIRLKK
jgi:hypothetical protein